MKIIYILKQFVIMLGVIVGVFCLFLLAFWMYWRWGYYDELNLVKAEIQKINGVHLIAAGGNEDLKLEDIFAEIDVSNKGKLRLNNLTPNSFTKGDKMVIEQIGNLSPLVKEYGYQGVSMIATGEQIKSPSYGTRIQLNRESEFKPLFPFKAETVQDVILHYDDIYAIISKWPNCPDYSTRIDSKGLKYCYCVSHDGDEHKWPSGCNDDNAI